MNTLSAPTPSSSSTAEAGLSRTVPKPSYATAAAANRGAVAEKKGDVKPQEANNMLYVSLL